MKESKGSRGRQEAKEEEELKEEENSEKDVRESSLIRR